MKTNQIKKGNFFIAVAFLMMLILFISSSQTAAEQSTVPLMSKMLKDQPFKDQLASISFTYAGQIVSIKKLGYYAFVEFFIRKAAHFTTYFILGGSWFLGLLPRIKSSMLTFVVAWLSATGYAGLDEFHQMLTGGRSPLFQDVALDSTGAFTACMMCLLGYLLLRRRKKSRK